MEENRKEQIILATLNLASNKGLGGVSMSMIAESIGIKKPSLYNHFKSKADLINQMYTYLREQAIKKTHTQPNSLEEIFNNLSACEVMQKLVNNYIVMNSEKNMQMFYKVIYAERTISSEAAKIMVAETEKMINATKQVFKVLQDKKLLMFNDIEISAISFALTVHGLIDYEADKSFSNTGEIKRDLSLINNYIFNFCKQHAYK